MRKPYPEIPTTCSHCHRPNDQHAGPTDDSVPEDGDVGLCYGCGLLMIFVGDPVSDVRKPTDSELSKFMADPDIRAGLTAYHGGGDVLTMIANYRRAAKAQQ